MKPRDYLGQIRTLGFFVQGFERELTNTDSIIDAYGEMVRAEIQQGLPYVETENFIRKLTGIRQRLVHEKDRYQDKRDTIIRQIMELESDTFRKILLLHYVAGISLIGIADSLVYSERYVANAHAAALQEFARKHNVT